MQNHVKIYLEYFKPFDTPLCESCGGLSCEIHHITPRSKFGSKTKHLQDHPSNLIALCRTCHEKAHNQREFNNELKEYRLLNM